MLKRSMLTTALALAVSGAAAADEYQVFGCLLINQSGCEPVGNPGNTAEECQAGLQQRALSAHTSVVDGIVHISPNLIFKCFRRSGWVPVN